MFGNVVSDQFLDLGDYPFGAAMAAALTFVLLLVLMVLRSRSYRAEQRIT
jgi:ABC-type spermidine/putrescine transport system permease subunit I